MIVTAVVASSGIFQPLPALASGNYAAAALADAPTGFWRLAETNGTIAADASGHNNVLTYVGGYTLGAPGSIVGDADTAVQFNGSTATANRNSSPVASTTNWSVEAWINPATIVQSAVTVYNGKEDTTDGGYGFGISSPVSLTTTGSELVGVVNGAAIDSGYAITNAHTWYHVVMTRDTSRMRFYVNGRMTSKTSTTAPSAPVGRFSVGSGINSAGLVVQGFNGLIDDVAIYPAVLPAGRIGDHYQEGTQTIGGLGQWASFVPTVSGGTLTPRFGAAVAYDGAHARAVMFGGSTGSGTPLAETWTFDAKSNTWTELFPIHTPSARFGAGMAYNAATGSVVLFGGTSSATSGYMSDTWTWNGSDWTQVFPSAVPPTRAGAAMAYDSAHNVVVMFGGNGGSNGATVYNTTYTWNGSNWTLASSTGVSARTGAVAAYDTSNSQVVLFGGFDGSSYHADTHAWNGSAWTTPNSATSPSARFGAGAAFDPIVGKTVLFGGYNGSNFLADVWTWDGANWALQKSAANPAARAGAAVVWNTTGADILLFGGLGSGGALSDSWVWTTPPDTPKNVSGTSGNQQVTVTWSAPGNGGAVITQYVVTASPGGATATVTGSPAPTSATVGGLTNGIAYTFKVTATNAVGTSAASAPSSPVTPMTVPDKPTNVSAVAGNAQATVSWTPPASNGGSAITGYTVTSSPGGITESAGASATSATVTGLTNGTTYTFTVAAANSVGSGPASDPSNAVTPATVPGAPTGVTATGGDAQATVNWTAPASNGGSAITSYAVTSSPGNVTATVGGSATSATVTGLTNGTSYTFTVAATNTVGTGSSSSASNAVTPNAVPGPPTNVTATAGNGQATVSWTAPTSNGGSPITSYTVTPYVGTTAGSPNQVPASSTSTTITGLTNGATYTFQVTANNSAGSGVPGTSNAVTPTGPPYAPTNVTAVGGNAQATVSWTAPGNGGSPITGYTLTPYVGSSPGSPVSVGPNITSTTITGLANGTTYTFQVTATNSLGTSAPGTSNAVTPATVPQPPGNVTAAAGNQQATVSWTAPANGGSAITGYTVTPYAGTIAGTPVSVGPNTTSVVVTGLTNGTTYTFQVVASNAVGNSTPGSSNAVTPAAVPGAPTNVAATTGNAQSTVSWNAPASNGGAPITSYTVTPYVGTTAGTPASTPDGSTTTLTVTGLSNGTTYTFQVYATNSAGNGPSATSNAVTIGLPSAPTNVTATAGVNRANVSWTASSISGSSAITGYLVTGFIGSQPFNSIAVGASVTTMTLSGLMGGTPYAFQVTAINNQGNSPASATSAPVTPTGPPTTYASTVLSDTPSTYLRLGDPSGTVAADSSGNGNHGSYNLGVTLGATSMIGSDSTDTAVSLDGSTGYISTASVPALQGGNTRSVEFWFNASTSTQSVLFDSGDASVAGKGFQIGITQDGGVPGAPLNTAGVYVNFNNYAIYVPGLHPGDGVTHHLVVTLQGSTVSVFFDNTTPQGSVYNGSWSALTAQPFTLAVTPNTTANAIWIGHGRSQVAGNGATFFSGIVDEVAVYPTALTASQVNADFAAAADGLPSAPGNPSALGGVNQATITWTASAANGAPITSYVVSTQSSASCPVSNARSVPGSSTSTVIGGLPAGACSFSVRAVNGFGYSSASSATNAATITGQSTTFSSTLDGLAPSVYYRLGDLSPLIADSSGNASNAKIVGNVSLAAPGPLDDGAATFFGGYVQNQSLTSLPAARSPRTFEAWVKTTNLQDQVVLMYGTNGSGSGLELGGCTGQQGNICNGQTIEYVFSSDPNFGNPFYVSFAAPSRIANGQWHFVVISWDGTNLNAYLDGQPVGQTVSFTLSEPGADGNGLVVGRTSWNASRAFNGSLTEVAVYPIALNAAQVLSQFNSSGYSVPAASTGLSTVVGANKVSVSWNAAQTAAAYPVVSYLVTAYKGATAINSIAVSGTTLSATVTGLGAGTAYTLQVRAMNNFGLGPSAASGSVTPTGAPSTYASTILGDTPVLYYRGGDPNGSIAADSSGNGMWANYGSVSLGNQGALANDTATAMGFSATGAVQLVPPPPGGLPSGNAARSFEAWFKTSSTADQVIVEYGSPFGNGGWSGSGLQISTNGTKVGLIYANDGNGNFSNNNMVLFNTVSSASITNGFWHHVVVAWDGTTASAYVDGVSLGSQPFSSSPSGESAFGLLVGADQWANSRNFNGSLQEVAVYRTALTAAQVQAHFTASGNNLPGVPTNVTATPGIGTAIVNWTPPTTTNGTITKYTVNAITDGSTQSSVSTDGTATSVAVPNLTGGQSYTFTVSASNAIGMGPASAPSPTITISAPANGSSPIGQGFGQYLYFRHSDLKPFPDGTIAFESENTLPTLSTWTVEGWLQLNPSTQTTGSGGAFGLITGQAGSVVAGVSWDQSENATFVWPLAAGGQGSTPISLCDSFFGHCAFQHVVLEYDGTFITGYVKGNQVYHQPAVSSAAITTSTLAGFVDHDLLTALGLDEVRISSIARYSGATISEPGSPLTNDGNTVLLWHLDEQGVRKMWQFNEPLAKSFQGEFPDSSGNGHGMEFYTVGQGCIACGSTYRVYALGQGRTAAELDGSGSPWECPCTLSHTGWPVNSATGEFSHAFDDISVPGRGFGLDFSRTYSSDGASILGPLGFGWTDSYAAGITLTTTNGVTTAAVRAGNGSAVTFTQSGSNFIAPGKVLASLVHNADGSFTMTQQDVTKLNFDSSGRLTSQVDRNGYATTFTYDSATGLLTAATEPSQGNPSPRSLTIAYKTGTSLIQSVTDTAGRSVSFSYDSNSNMTGSVDINGNAWQYSYDSLHELTVMKAPLCVATPGCNGIVNIYTNGQVTQQTDAAGRVTKFGYSSDGVNSTSTITDPNGDVTVDDYVQGMLITETRASGTPVESTWAYAYDPLTQSLVTLIDSNGSTTTTIRDTQAHLLSKTDARGNTATYTYNSFGQVLGTTPPAPATATTNTYDAAGNLLSSSTPLAGTSQARTTTYTYGDASHPGDATAMTDPDNNVSNYTYDQYGNKSSSTDSLGNRTTFSVDLAGHMTSKVSARGNVAGCGCALTYTWTYTYWPSGALHVTTDPLGNSTSSTLDADSNLLQVTDADGHVVRHAYDLDDERISETNGYGTSQARTIQTVYDNNGNIIRHINALSPAQSTIYAYDQQNRLVSVTDPLNRQTTYTYDAVGNRLTMTDGNGHITNYSYDALGEVVSVIYQTAQPGNIAYTYRSDGLRLSMSDETGTTTYQYDSLGRLTQVINGSNAAVGYVYDLAGNVISITYPGGVGSVTRTYYANGWLKTVSDWLGHTTTYTYDPEGNLSGDSANPGVVLPNGVQQINTTDPAGRTGRILAGTGGSSNVISLSYTRDGANFVTSENGVSYGPYDPLNRLTASSQAAYKYDSADRITQISPAGTSTVNALAYDNGDQLTSSTVTSGGVPVSGATYTFDSNGNRVGQTDLNGHPTSFVWDQANHLVGYSSPGAVAGYTYNGDGLRMSKTVGGATAPQTWDIATQSLPVLITDGGTYYVTGLGGTPLERISGSTIVYYHLDQLGSVRSISDGSGSVAETYSYDPYGNAAASGSIAQPFQFTGQYTDAESGLYYLRARYYETSTAQFVSVDPALVSTRHPYAYTTDNPVNAADASGLCDWWNIGCQAGQAKKAIGTAFSNLGTTVHNFDVQNAGLLGDIGDQLTGISGWAGTLAVACGVGAAIFAATVIGGAALGTCATVAGVVSIAAGGLALVAHSLACNGNNQNACGQIGWDVAGILLGVVGFGVVKVAARAAQASRFGPAAARFLENCAGIPLGVGGITISVSDWYLYEKHQPGIASG